MIRPFRRSRTSTNRGSASGGLSYGWLMQASGGEAPRLRILRWLVLASGIATHTAHDVLEGDPFWQAVLPTLAFVTQIVLLTLGHMQVERRRWPPIASWSAALLLSLACGAFAIWLHPPRMTERSGWLAPSLVGGLGVLSFWLLVFYFPTQLARARTRALAAESERRKAELERLRANLHPHFLLNTLNAMAGLLVVDPEKARQLVIALGELLHDALEADDGARFLADEIDWLKRYAQIFEIRHAGAIRFDWHLDPATLRTPLPRLLLQPLIENAIKHGALRRHGGGTVTLSSRRVGGLVEIVVADDGPGLSASRPPGLGLKLVEDRLRLAHPDGTLSIESSSAGTCILLRLPMAEAA